MAKLNPTVVTDKTVGDVLFDEQAHRRRPVIAVNDEGETVVCCRRTARKYGWKVQTVAYSRTRTARKPAQEDFKPVQETSGGRRSTDKPAPRGRRAADKDYEALL